jgi:hypothetical protein
MSYPAPPSADEPHYTPIYPAPPASAPQNGLLDGGPQQQRMFGQPQDIYAKIENLSDVLQQQAQHASHALGGDPGAGVQPSQLGSPADQKANRLRKACDSCSIRKVKVGAVYTRSRGVDKVGCNAQWYNMRRHCIPLPGLLERQSCLLAQD